MHIAVYIHNSPTSSYSGGRLHVMLLTEALLLGGHDVHMITNAKPSFFDEFSIYPNHHRLHLHVHPTYTQNSFSRTLDWVFVVPHGSHSWFHYGMYLKAIATAFKQQAKLLLINFESSSWFRSVSSSKKPLDFWADSKRTAKYVDCILSISNEGNRYAQKDYRQRMNQPLFTYCHPCVNSLCIDNINHLEKSNRILFFPRWSNDHKNSSGIMHLLTPKLKGSTFVIIVGSGETPLHFEKDLEEKAAEVGIHIELHYQLSERQKFKQMAMAKVVVLLSSFEGYGLLPVEAQYCGTPCIAFDLPVLREVKGEGLFLVPLNAYQEIVSQIKTLINNPLEAKHLKTGIAKTARIEHYVHRIQTVLETTRSTRTSVFKKAKRIVLKGVLLGEQTYFRCFQLLHAKKDPSITQLSKSLLQAYIQQTWKLLRYSKDSKTHLNIAIFGAGAHTLWLERIVDKINGPNIVAILDDNPSPEVTYWGLKPMTPEKLMPYSVDAIILSSDTHIEEMQSRCEHLFGHELQTVNLYEGLPPGPYVK